MIVFLRHLFCFVTVTVAMTLMACNQNKSNTDDKKLQSSIEEIRNKLESDVIQQKEEPFQSRPFKPYIGDDWVGNAISYGCYREGQAPGQKGPSEEEVLEDLNIISKHWNLIRVYGSGNDTRRILEVIEKHKLPIKMMMGIWLEPDENNLEKRNANIYQVVDGIELTNLYSDIVIAVSVGNETQVFWSWHKMNSNNLIRYIRAVRNNITVPVTTADDYNFWNKPKSKQVADEIDFVATHMHPLWNGKQIENSMKWVGKIYNEIQDMHPDRLIIVGETGWATDYNASKKGDGQQGTLIKGEVGVEAQAKYIIQHNEWVDSNKIITFLFEAFDESWKGGGENSPDNEVEKHWGVYNEDRIPKESFLMYLESIE